MSEQERQSFKRKVFIIRPWHNEGASLYPYIMDGIEYIEAVIRTIFDAFPKEYFDVVLDSTIFPHGIHVNDSAEKNIRESQFIIALLDGLRPNVVYELGIAAAVKSAERENILRLHEKDATVLVRNYYPNPMKVPTVDSGSVTIYNPRLDICKAFSDAAGVLNLTYDRNNLHGLAEKLRAYADQWMKIPSKYEFSDQDLARDSVKIQQSKEDQQTSEQEPPTDQSIADLWDDYSNKKYDEIIKALSNRSRSAEEDYIFALSFMRLGDIFSAHRMLSKIPDDQRKPKMLFHLGICCYILDMFGESLACFTDVKQKGYTTKTLEDWIRRTKDKLSF